MKVTQTETERELKTVEETTTIEKIKCDICGHIYSGDSWDGNEFSVNPDISREVHSISGLDDLFDSYHRKIPTTAIDDEYSVETVNVNVPKKDLIEVVSEESEVAVKRSERSEKEQLAMDSLKQKYVEKIGTHSFYLIDNYIHHFMYRLNLQAASDDSKHVCNDCYDVIFD